MHAGVDLSFGSVRRWTSSLARPWGDRVHASMVDLRIAEVNRKVLCLHEYS